MGRFKYQIQESCWRDVYVRFDDEELRDLIVELRDEGRSLENIRQEVVEWLQECDDEDYGDADDYETLETDYDSCDDNVFQVADEFLEEFDEDFEEVNKVLGDLEDD